MPAAEVRSLLHHSSPLVRANALEALVIPAQHDRGVVEEIVSAISDTANRFRLMGSISIAHVGVACLVRVGTTEALDAAKVLWSAWPEPDRTDLTRYLESEGLRIG
jgi:hypothetical protein